MATRAKRIDRRIADLVSRYKAGFGRDACLSSILRTWMRANEAPGKAVDRAFNIQRISEISPASDLETQLLAATQGQFSLKQVEVAFENLSDADDKRAHGVVYTPNYIIDYIIKRCFAIRAGDNPPTILDPACGSGGFLLRAAKLLSENYDVPIEKTVNEHVYGIDVSRDAIECASVAIEMFCAEQAVTPPATFDFLLNADTLCTSSQAITRSLGIDEHGFDVIVTNPPYVKLQNLDEDYRETLSELYSEFATGSFSLAMLFLVAGYRLLSQNGALGYITQNNIYTSLAGAGVREFLQNNGSLHTIVDFGHKKIFPDASAYTCLLFLGRTPHERLQFFRCSEPESEILRLRDDDFHDIPLNVLDKKKWRLAPEHHLRNLRKLESNGTPLGELSDIKVGFATLKDSVFIVNNDFANQDIEEGITRPAIKIANFSDERSLESNQARVIQPYRKSGSNKWVPLEDHEFQQMYPKAYSHLKAQEYELSKRDKGKKSPRRFFEWSRTQCMEAPGPKLLTKTFNRGPNFLLDETDSLFCNGYSVKPREIGDLFFDPIDIRVLQRILNSSVMDYYARLTSFQIEGGYQCFQKNFIERFCIPDVHNHSQTILSLEGEELQHYICGLFGVSVDEIAEVVHS